MFENLKIKFYSDKLIGYAYDVVDYSDNFTKYNVYLVIYQNYEYKYIKIFNISTYGEEERKKLIENFNKLDIFYITYWLDTFVNDDNPIVSNESKKKVLNFIKRINA